MTDWIGMSARPVPPPPELKGRVLARALAAGRRPPWWRLAAAAGVVLALAAAGVWSVRTAGTVRALEAERAALQTQIAALTDTLGFLRGHETRVIQIPVTTGGRVGAVTIFADAPAGRWLVRCDNLAANSPGETYQLWYITEAGVRSAALMPMNSSMPMTMGLELPADVGHVLGAAMTIEPLGGSQTPRGRRVFHIHL